MTTEENAAFWIGNLVCDYYRVRGLEWPNEQEAILWAWTEVAEAIEILVQKEKKWVRNNPEDKEDWSIDRFSEELGDAIMMLIVAGLVAGGNPLHALVIKMREKMNE